MRLLATRYKAQTNLPSLDQLSKILRTPNLAHVGYGTIPPMFPSQTAWRNTKEISLNNFNKIAWFIVLIYKAEGKN